MHRFDHWVTAQQTRRASSTTRRKIGSSAPEGLGGCVKRRPCHCGAVAGEEGVMAVVALAGVEPAAVTAAAVEQVAAEQVAVAKGVAALAAAARVEAAVPPAVAVEGRAVPGTVRAHTAPTISPGRLFRNFLPARLTTSKCFINWPMAPVDL